MATPATRSSRSGRPRDALHAVRNTTQQRDFQSFGDIFDRYLQQQQSHMDDLLES